MNLFEKIKHSNTPKLKRRQKISKVFFQLIMDSEGTYINIIDDKGTKLEPDYRLYNGAIRDVLKIIQEIESKNNKMINWETPSDHLYLAENEFLVWHLKFCDNVVDKDFNAINFVADSQKVNVILSQVDEAVNSQINVQIILNHSISETTNQLNYLTESHVLQGNTIYQIEPLGENFASLNFFAESFFRVDIEKYLSLLYSYFNQINVKYEDYKVVKNIDIKTSPSLIIEKIDEDGSLYVRSAYSAASLQADFLEQYDINTIVTINELERTINRSTLIDDGDDLHGQVKKQLNQFKKQLTTSFKKTEPKSDVTELDIDFYIEDELFIIEHALAKEFIYKFLPEVMQKYKVVGAEKLTSYKVKAVSPKLRLNLGFGINFLEGDAELDIDGELMGLFDVLQQYRKNSYISLNDGSHALVNQQYIEKLERIFKKKSSKKNQTVSVSFFDLPMVEELIDEKTASTSWNETFKQAREIFTGFNNISKARMVTPKIDAKLRSYQQQGYKWLQYLHKHSLGGCLADDMGLGKTLQAIALLSSIYLGKGAKEAKNQQASLIVMPKSLIFNWQNEIKKFCPELTSYVYYGMQRDLAEATKSQLILTTYGMVRSDIEKFQQQAFYYVILDESQQIKNSNSQINKAVMLLDAKHRLALSGTPIENNLTELYSLFRFLNPSMFGSGLDFNKHYAIPIQQHGDKQVAQELKSKIYPFILRRLKINVLKDLPDKIEQILYVDMSPAQEKLYHQRRLYYAKIINQQVAEQGIQKSQFAILQAMSELRQIASTPEVASEGLIISPKRELLREYLTESMANGHKALVFANYLSSVDLVGTDLNEQGIPHLSMTGATSNRQVLVDQFQSDADIKVFVMTLKTGGVGLNLTAADTIFIFDPWWNKAAENQAIDRAHRMGQDKTVFSYKLITRNTIEEKIITLQEKKSELFDAVISSDSASIKSMDESDINFILSE